MRGLSPEQLRLLDGTSQLVSEVIDLAERFPPLLTEIRTLRKQLEGEGPGELPNVLQRIQYNMEEMRVAMLYLVDMYGQVKKIV